MAGRIKAEDVTLVKERSNIEDVVREHVTLTSGGTGSLKGLCPFHDEKSASFYVRPAVGAYHCFGCGEGGDVISFVQKVDHLTFSEAVERLAQKAGVELRYEEGGGPREEGGLGRRTRLLEAHRVAEEYYSALLLDPGNHVARTGRDFLRERGFDGDAARHFGVGFAPRGGEDLVRHLRAKGFTDDELVTAGLAGRGQRGLYDRFRGRLVWPIRDITGDTVGFGARRIFEDDRIEAKYLNTSETPIYKKSTVLYGLDLAKKAISRDRTAVVVEGYTDVMACHLSGVEGAVATCGTSFGVDHIKLLRRIMRDEADVAPARVVFTFDGDAAGQKAAMRAFGEDQRWASQSFVAVADDGQDPCELRLSGGALAVRGLVEDAVPMFEFAVRTTLRRFDLETAEGRVQALRAAAPIVASIRDRSLRPEYTRVLSGLLGLEVEQVGAEVSRAGKAAARAAEAPAAGRDRGPGVEADASPEPTAEEVAGAVPRPDLSDPVVLLERQLLQVVLQFPGLLDPGELGELDPSSFSAPAHRAVFEGVVGAGLLPVGLTSAAWADRITQAAPLAVRGLISELAVAQLPMPTDRQTGQPSKRWVLNLVLGLREMRVVSEMGEARSAIRRIEAQGSDPEKAGEIARRLAQLGQIREALRTRMSKE